MGTGRVVVSTLCLIALAACSPGRIAADGGTDGGSGSESEDGPFVDSEGDSGEDDSDDDGGPGGGCSREGSVKFLDICEESDPCDATACVGDLVCLGGQCVAPKPADACQGIALVDFPFDVELETDHGRPLLLANIDGIPGDELISAGQGQVEVLRAGEVVISAVLPDGYVNALHPIQLDGDEHVDLLVFSEPHQDAYTVLLSGDGLGHFELALAQLPGVDGAVRSPFPLDFDNDGDHDLVATTYANSTQLYRNDAGAITWLTELAIDGGLGVATDLDLDGFIDDALFGDYPSPIAAIGDGGQLLELGRLPEPPRGPTLQYGVGRPLSADLDGDGFVDVFSPLTDDEGRVGGRIWWGQPDNTFSEPRDQMLEEDLFQSSMPTFVGFVELDGAPPLELLYSTQDKLGYVRPDLQNRLPFACFEPELLVPTQQVVELPAVGDIDADGRVEIAIRDSGNVEVYTVVAEP